MPTWDLLEKDWNSLGDWTKLGPYVSEISPPGQLHNFNEFSPVSNGRYKYLAGGLPDQFYIRTRIVGDNLVATFGHMDFEFRNGIHDFSIGIYSDRITITREIGGWYTKYVDTFEDQWYIWDFVVDSSIGKVTIYRDEVYITDYTGIVESASGDGLVLTNVATYLAEMHEDYVKIRAGLTLPPLSTEYAGKMQAVSDHVPGIAKALPIAGVVRSLTGGGRVKSNFKRGKVKALS